MKDKIYTILAYVVMNLFVSIRFLMGILVGAVQLIITTISLILFLILGKSFAEKLSALVEEDSNDL